MTLRGARSPLPAVLLLGAFVACAPDGEGREGRADQAGEQAARSTVESDGVTIQYVAHACFVITSPEGVSLLVDPYESRWWLGYDFPTTLGGPDAALLSHPHPDHDAGYEAGRDVPWGEETAVLTSPGQYVLDDITVFGIRGKHADPYGEEFGQRNTIWLIETDGLRIAHIGDNGPVTDEIVEDLGRVDILMLPVDDIEHILSHEAVVEWRTRLSPRVLVPMHYRHDDLEVDPESPSDLASIDEWLTRQRGVETQPTNMVRVRYDVLPELPQVWVFPHYPTLTPPR
ncbi:MAG: MBL fold metallo-hydrolase [Gemmatimonadota bacterium]|nr:MBL fold metallo-hydrolase [Gemmatimonadota bacterium]